MAGNDEGHRRMLGTDSFHLTKIVAIRCLQWLLQVLHITTIRLTSGAHFKLVEHCCRRKRYSQSMTVGMDMKKPT